MTQLRQYRNRKDYREFFDYKGAHRYLCVFVKSSQTRRRIMCYDGEVLYELDPKYKAIWMEIYIERYRKVLKRAGRLIDLYSEQHFAFVIDLEMRKVTVLPIVEAMHTVESQEIEGGIWR